MRTLGLALVALSCLIALAGLADAFGPFLDARGIPLTGSLSPWQFWVGAGLISLASGIVLWRRGNEPRHRHAPPATDTGSEVSERPGVDR
jgi:LPXTG-motif cell wall-anchored protein